ncbi:MAG TPA: hypothetical protein DDY70_00870, partial [Clostridiales bacterium]|nr:hypothetical protein [Clostridiales bacterium]
MPKVLLPLKGSEKVGLIGLGTSTRGVAEVLAHSGIGTLTLRAKETIPSLLPPSFAVRCYTGDTVYDEIWEDILFFSPSARREDPRLLAAKSRGCRFSSDAELFFDNTHAPVFAVTGSDGKSTTATLTSLLLSGGAYDVRLAGNIGRALSPLLFSEGRNTLTVAELSSFQLQYLSPRTRRAVITNLTPNHLNWHKDFAEYKEAKSHLLTYAEDAVLSADDEGCVSLFSGIRPFAVFSVRESLSSLLRYRARHVFTLSEEAICLDGRRLLPLSEIRLPGVYNIKNFMAAIALSMGYTDEERILSVARTFSGISHRAELVATRGGVRYVDSSIDSSPARTLSTLSALTDPPILLIGGKGKGVPFDSLIPTILS